MPIPRLFCALLLAAAAAANAQVPAYPAGPVRIVVPFTPGTGADIIARIMQAELARR